MIAGTCTQKFAILRTMVDRPYSSSPVVLTETCPGQATLPRSPENNDSDGDGNPPTLTREMLARYLRGDFAAEQALFSRFQRDPALAGSTRPAHAGAGSRVRPRRCRSGGLSPRPDFGHSPRFRRPRARIVGGVLVQILERTITDISRRLGAQKRGGGRTPLDLEPLGERSDGIGRFPSHAPPPRATLARTNSSSWLEKPWSPARSKSGNSPRFRAGRGRSRQAARRQRVRRARRPLPCPFQTGSRPRRRTRSLNPAISCRGSNR